MVVRGTTPVAGATVERARTPGARRSRPRLAWPRLAWPWELLVLVVGDLLYEIVRAMAPQHESRAFANARLVMNLEPSSLLRLEDGLRQIVTDHGAIRMFSAAYYTFPHLLFTGSVLIWLWRRRPERYATARTALFLLTITALGVFWVFPVAPPRLAVPGAANHLGDLILGGSEPVAAGAAGFSLVNPYAAFPSLHCAWAAWCAWAIWSSTTHSRRWLAWLHPMTTTLVVVGTANHYVLDVVAGIGALALAVTLIAWSGQPARASAGDDDTDDAGGADGVGGGSRPGSAGRTRPAADPATRAQRWSGAATTTRHLRPRPSLGCRTTGGS